MITLPGHLETAIWTETRDAPLSIATHSGSSAPPAGLATAKREEPRAVQNSSPCAAHRPDLASWLRAMLDEHGRMIAESVTGAKLVVLDDAAHLAAVEQPERITELIEQAKTPFTEPFQDYITRCAWGSVWTREGLDRRTRSCIRSPCWPRSGVRTRSPCTCAPACATVSRKPRSRRCCCTRRSTPACPPRTPLFAIAQGVLVEGREE
jgi:hypothetical protein